MARSPAPDRTSPRPPPKKRISRSDRRYQLDRQSDQRTAFQRDRDRILYSPIFRRLAGITQVVHAAEGHIFHNRLTHTIKVAQTGRRVAEHLLNTQPDAADQVNADVVEAAALAHDLGHPPFGHIAESELNTLLMAKNISDGFEGNSQSFRVVTKFGLRLGKTPGLNLTRASLNAILKYPWAKDENNKKPNKWGYYQSEIDDFAFARELEPEEMRRSAEAEIMDWADDVAYSVHDVEDFYRAGLIPLDQILAGTKERDRFINNCFKRWANDPDKPKFVGLDKSWASKFFDDLNFFTVKFDLTEPFCASLAQLAGLDFLTAFLIKRYVRGPDDDTKVLTLVNRRNQPHVQVEPRLRAEVELLKKLMSIYVFDNASLVAQQFGQRRVIRELFEILFEAAKPGSKDRGIIPEPFRELVAASGPTDDTGRARVVADLIGSMTEQQALLFHQRLLGINPGSVRDLIIR